VWGRTFESRCGRSERAGVLLQKALEIDPENRIARRVLDPSLSGTPIRLGTTGCRYEDGGLDQP
jgi:hypothetical protein